MCSSGTGRLPSAARATGSQCSRSLYWSLYRSLYKSLLTHNLHVPRQQGAKTLKKLGVKLSGISSSIHLSLLPNGQLLGAYGREWREDQEKTGDGAEEETCWKCLGSTWKPQKTKDRKAGLGPTKCTVCAGSGLVTTLCLFCLFTGLFTGLF